MSAVDDDSAAVYWDESVPGDASAGLAAYAAGTIGVLSAAALGAMFAVEVPRGGPYVAWPVGLFAAGRQLHRRRGAAGPEPTPSPPAVMPVASAVRAPYARQ